ncbi:DUF938 domain-containing protein [Oceanicoccus sp. KOV_DT_Chl]|uniref:DUF938 domain-containing protein n=1 Tax=Oceanicoccus sp. KOV_DT_Chl TaxID=1904639 RepID=UPI000C7E3F2B|nr:DUF938 domain-containing protein [Oceanicoccus sp. KOV_DT_Chl]
MDRPFSQACENNKAAILAVLQQHLAAVDFVFEVGSGTGQHAVHFSQALPHLQWQPADQQEYIEGINAWLEWAAVENILTPLTIDIEKPWPIAATPAIFSANTLHIMSWPEVEVFFSQVARVLTSPGVLCIYGPFNYDGHYTSESNARFDQWLKQQHPLSAIRNFEAVHTLAMKAGLSFVEDYAMPANNRCLIWNKD